MSYPKKELCREVWAAQFVSDATLARRQHAKIWELRATVELSRLWLQQGRNVDVRSKLAEIYEWFSEGQAMSEFQEARALLSELQ